MRRAQRLIQPTTGRRRWAAAPADIQLVILDFDGTMTDDRVYVDQQGRELVCCHRADGWGVRLLRRAGIDVMCLTTEQNPVVRHRCRKLGIPLVNGAIEKGASVRRVLRSRGVPRAQCVFLGNGLNDLQALRAVGWPVVVRGAHPQARRVAKRILRAGGGEGAVLELAEWLLNGRGREQQRRVRV